MIDRPAPAFAALVESNEGAEGWKKEREDAVQFVMGLESGRLFGAIADNLDSQFLRDGTLPSRDDLQRILRETAVDSGVSAEGLKTLKGTTVERMAISGGLAWFLSRHKDDLKAIEGVATVEHFLDTQFVADCIRQGNEGEAWLGALTKTCFGVLSLNDDENAAADALEEWKLEVQKPVPTWRHGDFPHLGIATSVLVSEILRKLDEIEWLKFLDRLELPAFVEALLWSSNVEQEPDRVLRWIAAAPLAYTSEGVRTSSSVVFILERRAHTFLERDLLDGRQWGEDQAAFEAALSAQAQARRELAEALCSRPDGPILLAELGARHASSADQMGFETPVSKAYRALDRELGLDYARQIGASSDVLALLKKRSEIERGSRWGLWLLAADYAFKVKEPTDTRPEVLQQCWPWLVEILVSGDPAFTERSGVHAEWTEWLTGVCLACTDEPLAGLNAAWTTLAKQRLAGTENPYSNEAWGASRFLTRAAFFAYGAVDEPDIAISLWRTAMNMAICLWFSPSRLDPFSEVAVGLAHLAAGKREVPGEPQGIFEYLVGLPTEVRAGVELLLRNGMSPATVVDSAFAAGIDVVRYLKLARNERNFKEVDTVLRQLEGLSGDLGDEIGP